MKRRAMLVALAAAGALLVSPAPVQAGWDFDEAIKNANSPVGKTVEVVNKMPSYWEVRTGVLFVDKYTTSKVKFVKACTGIAWRCVIIKPGSLAGKPGGPIGWHSKGVITIDINRAKYYGYAGSAKFRKQIIAHEFGHNRGLPHSSGRNIMYRYAKRQGMYLPLYVNHDQRATLKKF